jgi:hypothetical protein
MEGRIMEWLFWSEQLPHKENYLMVWDTRINEPRMVFLDDEGILTESNGRRYDYLTQMFYSHWYKVEELSSINKLEMRKWIEEKGVRIGTDK